jgi:two-component system, OmpR family, sensor histidine kinase QseC
MNVAESSWSLKTRLIILLTLLASGLFALSSWQSYRTLLKTSERQFDDSMRESAGLLLQLAQHEMEEHGQALGLRMLTAETRPGPYEFRYQVWTADMRSGYLAATLHASPLVAIDADGFGWTQVGGERWRAFSMWNPNRDLQMQIAQPERLRSASNRGALIRTVVTFIALLMTTVASIWIVVGATIRPLNEAAILVGLRSAHDLRHVDFDNTPVEIRPLGDALNRLLERFRVALQVERRFTADAAHELRTPLAAIRANTQVLVSARDDDERSRTAQDLLASVDRGGRLIEQLLALARADIAEGASVVLGRVDLPELIRDQCAEHAQAAAQQRITILSATTPSLISGDRALLAVMLRNLVDNALRYSPEGGSVTVSCHSNEKGVELDIMDAGPGVPLEEREHIFERFYRLPNQGVLGSGLGLSIARRVAELHQATIVFLDSPVPPGTLVRVAFRSA